MMQMKRRGNESVYGSASLSAASAAIIGSVAIIAMA